MLNAKDKSRAFLASKIGLLTITLQQGNEQKLKRLSFEVSPNADFAVPVVSVWLTSLTAHARRISLHCQNLTSLQSAGGHFHRSILQPGCCSIHF